MRRINLIYILILCAMGIVQPVHARIITIRADGTGDYPTIQDAIDGSLSSDSVVLECGTYKGVNNYNLNFNGKSITIRSSDPNSLYITAATIIDCESNGSGFIFNQSETFSSIVSGLTIINGSSYDGGGIHCEGASPLIRSCIFSNCSAEHWGGGIFCRDSSVKIQNCTFRNNSANEGAAISTHSWTREHYPVIENCFITGNTASDSGGGINSDWLATPTISGCVIVGNLAGNYGGGGISSFQSNPTIVNCIIVGNTANSSGGGILCWYYFGGVEPGPIIKNCTISNNRALHYGGGLYIDRACKVKVNNCIFWDNIAALGSEIGLLSAIGWGASVLNITYTDINGEMSKVHVEPGGTLVWGDGNISINPSFIRPPNDGGDGWRIGGNDDFGDMHLSLTSSCINRGDPAGNYVNQLDMDGGARNSYGQVDIGADEVFPVAGDFEPDGDIDIADFAVFSSNWLLGVK